MKRTILHNQCKPGHARGQRGQTAAVLVGLVMALTLAGTGLKAQVPDISKAVLLSWPEPAQEQIVVGADSLATNAVWTPWPEPIFKRFGELCMTVPTTASQQFFKLVSGMQFVDDFSDSKLPFTNRIPWASYEAESGDDWSVTNGVLRLTWHGPTEGAFALIWPPGSNTWVADFTASVDILNWTTSGTNWSTLGIMARGFIPYPGGGLAFSAGLRLNAYGIPGNVAPWMAYGADPTTNGPTFQVAQFPPPYRVQYCGLGPNHTLRVISLTTGELIREMTMTKPSGRTEGFMGLWINAPAVSESHSITVDNYFAAGTRP